jgi:choline dehydrogenase-like flavoprotein
MLSGVGPADDLKSLGIPVVANLPEIGKNLWVIDFMALTSLTYF